MKKLSLGVIALSGGYLASASSALASWWLPIIFPPRPPAQSVPEIDASTGLLAAAAILAAMAFVWERNRRQIDRAALRDPV